MPFSRNLSPAVFVLAGMLLLAGCSGPAVSPGPPSAPTAGPGVPAAAVAAAAGSDAAGGSPPASVCTLLTQAEVDTALGQSLGAGNLVLPNDCLWTTTDFTAGVDVTNGDWAANVPGFMAAGKPPVAMTGVGDQAWSRIDSTGASLYFRKGDTAYSVRVNGPHVDGVADKGLAVEKVLALALLHRL